MRELFETCGQDWVRKASFALHRIVDAGTCAGYRFVSAEECVYGGEACWCQCSVECSGGRVVAFQSTFS